MPWNLYEVEEDESGARYWVVASSKEEAANAVLATEETEGGRDGLSVSGFRPDDPFILTFVDGFDDDTDSDGWRTLGFTVDENRHGVPRVGGPARQWAEHYATPMILSCSEWY